MRKLVLAVSTLALFGLAVAFATTDTKDDLIALDKAWGAANLKADKAKLNEIYADDMLVVAPMGMPTKAQMLSGLEPADDATYVTSDYKVKELRDDIAIVAHNAEGYRSLHVLEKQGGQWKVVATATVPMAGN